MPNVLHQSSCLFFFFQIEDCLVCSDSPSSVLFKPCNHMVACEGCSAIMKKCVECRANIDEVVPFNVCCGGKVGNLQQQANKIGLEASVATAAKTISNAAAAAAASSSSSSSAQNPAAVDSSIMMNNGNKDTTNTDVQKLQEQLNDIKEQVSEKKLKIGFFPNF